MSGTAIVTGASSGIGTEIALGLARAGRPLVLVGRSEAKTNAAAARVRAVVPGARVAIELADLASLAQTRALAERIARDHPDASLLVNNAGIFTSKRAVSADGHEMDYAVNHLATFQLAVLLLPTLRRNADARVVFVNSAAHEDVKRGALDLDGSKPFQFLRTYSASKLASMLAIETLAARVPAREVTIAAVHPGVVATNIFTGPLGILMRLLKPFLLTPADGAKTALQASLEPGIVSGVYISPKKDAAINPLVGDAALRTTVWDATVAATGVTPAELAAAGAA